jgi:hypothetical protein
MVLNLFATLFVLGAAFLNSMWGLYSGMVNTFCSIVALAVSFGYWEALERLLTAQFGLHPSYTGPLALGLLFLVTLTALRLLADNFLRGNVHVPAYVDWIGGGVCGFVYSQIIIGVLVLSFLMLPWGGRTMMYERYARNPDGDTDPDSGRTRFERRLLWMRSDEFAAGLFKIMSGGSLSSSTSFASVYPDFAQWVAWTGNQVQHESLTAPLRDEKTNGGDGWDDRGIRVLSWWEQKQPLPADSTRYRKALPTRETPDPPYEPLAFKAADGKQLVGVRLSLTPQSADRDEKGTWSHRFRATNIRLVGDVLQPDGSKSPRQYNAAVIGGADKKIDTNLRVADPDNNFALSGPGAESKIDVYFEVDDGFKPRFVEYRRRARAALAAPPAEQPPAERLSAAPPANAGAQASGGRPGQPTNTGAGRFIDVVDRGGTGDNDRLPFKLAQSKLTGNPDVEISDGMLVSMQAKSRLVGDKSGFEHQGPGVAIEKFKIPEGKRIFQVRAKAKQAQSLAGQVFNFAGATANQYRAVDSRGNTYELAGYYALVKRNGQDYFELFFAPNASESGFSGMLELSQETRTALRQQDDAVLGLIFVVPPGTCIRVIKSQGGQSDFGPDMCVGKG